SPSPALAGRCPATGGAPARAAGSPAVRDSGSPAVSPRARPRGKTVERPQVRPIRWSPPRGAGPWARRRAPGPSPVPSLSIGGSIIFETPPTWTTLRAGTTNHNPARVLSPPPRQHHPGGFTRYEDRCRRRRRILRLAHCPVPVAEGARGHDRRQPGATRHRRRARLELGDPDPAAAGAGG